MDVPSCVEPSPHWWAFRLFPFFPPLEVNWVCRGSQVPSMSDLGCGAARKQSQAKDGLIRVSAKNGKDDDNLGHTQNK